MGIEFAATPTMVPSPAWVEMSDAGRMMALNFRYWFDGHKLISIKEAHQNGHVIVELTQALSAAERGQALLDCEELLKKNVDPGITVWLAPMGDRSSLRNLRGIEMK